MSAGAKMYKPTEVIISDKLPRPVGPYSPAILSGNYIFTSGQIPLSPQTGKVVSDDFEEQVRQVLDNLAVLLQTARSSLQQIVKCTVFMTNLENFPVLNKVFAEYFPNNPPARSAVQVSRLPLDVLVEIEAIAVVNNEE